MKLAATYTLPGSRDKVYAALTDAGTIQKCIDGCEKLVQTGDGAYDAHLKIGVAGLKGSYVGKVQLRDRLPPESYTLLIEGKGSPGFVKATAKMQLVASGDSTKLTCDAEAQVGGLIAAVGSRLIEAAARKMMDEFFRKMAINTTGSA